MFNKRNSFEKKMLRLAGSNRVTERRMSNLWTQQSQKL